MLSFAKASKIIKVSEELYTSEPTSSWTQGRTLFGGISAGIALRALLEMQNDPERHLRSLLISFVAPVKAAKVEIQTQVLRVGKGLSSLEAKLSQDGQICTIVKASFGVAHSKSLQVEHPKMPDVPMPESLHPVPFMEGVMPNFSQHFDMRWTSSSFPFSGSEKAECQGWMQFIEKHSVGLPELVALLDAWPPPVFSCSEGPIAGSSFHWMINLFQEWPSQGASAEDWWFYDSNCSASCGGYADTDARLWNAKGELVALSRQMVVEFTK